MKKLNLNSAGFSKGEILTRAQLKQILGGNVASPGGTCQVLLPNTSSGGSNFGGMDWGGSSGHPYGSASHSANGTVIAGISYADAQQAVSNGGHWCCDSCGSASWAI
ncbi:hypothetical protein [Pedobacter rhodius]|uniref:Bacteriocin-type signal sequence-containing protein n=1 Tax=Pedobacter rhodius TaxID=3004098 RepID=A0ABT4KZH1_9SPHI|nr:hypothetical protein [Pedobacter sp. SJ11]MCZ4224331.1 hypothetical protein [Pedobacter sp. SJ11]